MILVLGIGFCWESEYVLSERWSMRTQAEAEAEAWQMQRKKGKKEEARKLCSLSPSINVCMCAPLTCMKEDEEEAPMKEPLEMTYYCYYWPEVTAWKTSCVLDVPSEVSSHQWVTMVNWLSMRCFSLSLSGFIDAAGESMSMLMHMLPSKLKSSQLEWRVCNFVVSSGQEERQERKAKCNLFLLWM